MAPIISRILQLPGSTGDLSCFPPLSRAYYLLNVAEDTQACCLKPSRTEGCPVRDQPTQRHGPSGRLKTLSANHRSSHLFYTGGQQIVVMGIAELDASRNRSTMHYTVFDTPVVRQVLHWISRAYLNVFKWRCEGLLPNFPKCVMIAAPHTSNWDFPITMFIAFALRAKVYWMGKESLFRKPFGSIMRWLGGIPIDRSRANNVVAATIDVFNTHDDLIIIIPPEGTRGKVSYWKTGFYHIAAGAGVPIVLGFLDYRRKAGGIGPSVMPTGDIEKDMATICSFYAGVTAKYPEKSSMAAVAPRPEMPLRKAG